MPWGAIIGAGVGLYTAHKEGKRQDKAMKAQQENMEKAVGSQEEGLHFSQGRYDDVNNKWQDVYGGMMDHIDDGITPDYAAIGGDVNASFDTAQGMERRQMQRYGIKPTDGALNHARS